MGQRHNVNRPHRARQATRDIVLGAVGGALAVAPFGLGWLPVMGAAVAAGALIAFLEREKFSGVPRDGDLAHSGKYGTAS